MGDVVIEMVRALFILIPAVCVGSAVALAEPVFGVLVFFALCVLGVEATEPRPERGEAGSNTRSSRQE